MTVRRFWYFLFRHARRVVRLFGFLVGLVAAALIARPAAGEIYLSDSSVEISGTGIRASRNCTVLLKPTQTFGENLAPRVILVTSGAARLSFGLDTPAQYTGPVIVQNNTRRPLVSSDNVTIEQFRLSDIGKALKSQRLFFVTAPRRDAGKFVSSRYARVDFDAILTKIEAVCPFEAESLMTDVTLRQRIERSLPISPSDLALIRWALNKRYAGQPNKPEQTSSLSQQERAYLKRYAADNGLALSQYLTADTAQKLIAEGRLIANQAVAAEVRKSAADALSERSAPPASTPAPVSFFQRISGARWCTPSRSYSLQFNGNTVVWRDSVGSIDVETISSNGSTDAQTITQKSFHLDGKNEELGTTWTYSLISLDKINVKSSRGKQAFSLLRC